MECVEAALKSSVRKELAVKSSPQPAAGFLVDIWAVQNGTSSDDFSVDELLDFSNEDDLVATEEDEGTLTQEKKNPMAAESPKQKDSKTIDAPLHGNDGFVPVPIPAGELGVPADDMASLEWLSHFVEDSNSEYSAPFPSGIKPERLKRETNFVPPAEEPCSFKTLVPAKARSKRTRTGIRVWGLGSPSTTDSSSSSTTTTSSSSSPSSSAVNNIHESFSVEHNDAVAKRPKRGKRPSIDGGGTEGRKCCHCGVQKTPQWRSGPDGAKTLCNACGVRFKSGRLLPEYRPACSPTFSTELHSNSHKKVLEMRKNKDGTGQEEPGLGPAVVVPSF